MNEVRPFCFDSHQVRVILHDSEPWFLARDVCIILGLNNITEALRGLDDDEKANFSIPEVSSTGPQQNRNYIIISEPGLYSLIFRSRKPEAKRFKRWVTHEVLPAIRKNGRYAPESDAESVTQSIAGVSDLPRLPRVLRVLAMNTARQLVRATGGDESDLDRMYVKYCKLLAAGNSISVYTPELVQASSVHAFLQERCELRPDLVERNNDLYAAYGRFCVQQGRIRSNREHFFKELYALSGACSFRPRKGGDRPRCVKGVGLLS